MSEYQIEQKAEAMQSRLDEEYLQTEMSEGEYNRRCAEITMWANERYQESTSWG